MAEQQRRDTEVLRERAQREIALVEATGAKAQASADFRMVFIRRRDGTRETVQLASRPH
jgi:hypothetical protein